MGEEVNWKIILDSLAQLVAEHGKRIKALESILQRTINILWGKHTGEMDICQYEIKLEELKEQLEFKQ